MSASAVDFEDMTPSQQFGYIIGQMLMELRIPHTEFATLVKFNSSPKSQVARLISDGVTRETADAHNIMPVILHIVRSDVGAKWIFQLQKAYNALPTHPFKKSPVADDRNDFGAVLARILDDAGISHRAFAKFLVPESNGDTISKIVRGRAVTQEWVEEYNIIPLLETHCPQSLAKYSDELHASIGQLERRQDIIANNENLKLSQTWARATAKFIQQTLDHSGDDLDDAVDDLKSHKLSYRRKFLQEARNWQILASGELDAITGVAAFREIVTIVADTYHVDEQHPLYPARREAELALGVK